MTNTLLAQANTTGKFLLVSNQFGYPIYAAHVTGQSDVEITDHAHEAAKFEYALNDAKKMAASISRACGYAFLPVAAH